MKILIIEDEERSFMRLKRLLQNIDETFEISGPVTSVSKAAEALGNADKENYGIIFADIRLEDGEVFDAFLQVAPNPQVPVIFTTAFNEYALDAFRSNGIAYILKPIVPQELEEAVEKAMCLIKGAKGNLQDNSVTGTETNAPAEMPMDYAGLFASLGLHQKQPVYREHFLVQNNDGYTVLNVQDINHIASENGITRAYLHNGRSMAVSYSLNDIEAQLNPAKFFRANRQYIIGIDSIERLNFHFNYKLSVHLKTYPDVTIIVSKEKTAQLKEWIDR